MSQLQVGGRGGADLCYEVLRTFSSLVEHVAPLAQDGRLVGRASAAAEQRRGPRCVRQGTREAADHVEGEGLGLSVASAAAEQRRGPRYTRQATCEAWPGTATDHVDRYGIGRRLAPRRSSTGSGSGRPVGVFQGLGINLHH